MVPVTSLWLPILLSAVTVFFASFIIHMVLRYHRSDFRAVPDEDAVLDALQPFSLPPGDYFAPFAGSPEGMKNESYIRKVKRGPVLVMTVLPSGMPSMAPQLAQWFVYCLIVSIFGAYVTGRALGPGAEYLAVFRFASTTVFMGYSLALLQGTIWYKRNWGFTLRSMFDGLIYGLLTAGFFGWLWPG
jgi:hypothetical protein